MKQLIAFVLAFIFAGNLSVRAQSDMIIKQRAKNLQNTVNQQPGEGAPAAPAPPPAPAPAAPTPPPPVVTAVDAQLKDNLDRLDSDISAMRYAAAVSNGMKQTLEADFVTFAKGSVRPSSTNLTKLADDLCAALGGKNISERDQGQLARAVNVVINNSMVTAAQAKSFVTVAQTSLKSAGVADAAVQTVTADLNAILDEVQKKKPKLYQ